MFELFYNQRIKIYPNGTKIITTFNKTVFNPLHNERHNYCDFDDREVPFRLPWLDAAARLDNLKRSKDKIFDIAFINNFDYFVTLTFDDNIINAKNEDDVHRVMRNWFNNMVKRYNFKYLAVPEFHKSKRIHFHLLCSGDLRLSDSGTVLIPERDNPVKLSTARKIHKNEEDYRTVYNLDNWNFGFSTVIKFEKCDDDGYGTTAIAKYLTKYITKDLTRVLKRYYYAGGNINREVETVYKIVPYETINVQEYKIENTDLKVKYQTIGIGV